MAEVKWIKITTNMFDDEKIKLIEKMPEGISILLIWIKLLTLAGKCNATGYIYLSEDIAYTDEMLSVIFNMPLSTIRLALHTFNQFGMIDISESHVIKIVNWEKHQNIQGLDKIREDTRKRVQAYRERQKALPESNVTVTEGNAIEEEKKKKKKENNDSGASPQKHSFISPTLEEVQAYCKERNNKVDAVTWHNFYTSKAWMIGKNKMKDWKAAVRTWEKGEAPQKSGTPQKPSTFNNFANRQYDASSLEKMLLEKSKGELND